MELFSIYWKLKATPIKQELVASVMKYVQADLNLVSTDELLAKIEVWVPFFNKQAKRLKRRKRLRRSNNSMERQRNRLLKHNWKRQGGKKRRRVLGGFNTCKG